MHVERRPRRLYNSTRLVSAEQTRQNDLQTFACPRSVVSVKQPASYVRTGLSGSAARVDGNKTSPFEVFC
jgi:hypothetical protein